MIRTDWASSSEHHLVKVICTLHGYHFEATLLTQAFHSMIVAGTLTNKMAPALRKVYDQVGVFAAKTHNPCMLTSLPADA